jgi:hypothetical protein
MDKKLPRKKLHKGMLLFYIACGIVLLLVFSLMTFRMVLTSKLNVKLDEIRAAGYPATLAELNDYYPAVPDDENAAILYEKAFSFFHNIDDKRFKQNNKKQVKVKEEYGKITKKPKTFNELVVIAGLAPEPVLGEQLNEAIYAASQQFVDANRDSIDILKKTAKMPKCRFPIDLNKGKSEDLEHLSKLRTLSRLLATETLLVAEDGNEKLVTENILTMLKICSDLDNEPILKSYIANISLQSITIYAIEYAISMIEFDEGSLQQISQALQASLDEDCKLLNLVFAGEQIMEISYDLNEEAIFNKKRLYEIAKLTGVDTLNKLKLLEGYADIFTMDKRDVKIIEKYGNYCNKREIDIVYSKWGGIYFLAGGATFALDVIMYRNLNREAKIKETIIGLAIERYRLKYHKLPVKLIQLVPEFIKELPNDPFTRKPFRYVIGDIEVQIPKDSQNIYKGSYKRQTSHDRRPVPCVKRFGWMLYSLGQDLKDDNGIVAEGYSYRVGDIPFKCVRKTKNSD